MIIGITGSFGSGKTTVANLFKKYNFKIINVDKLYYGIYKTNKSLKIKLKKEFGTANRAKIKKIVFNDYKKLKSLNEITHPIILNETIKKIRKIRLKDKKINVMIDAPLLLEAKAKKLVDKIIVVKCKKNIQIKRILQKKKKYSEKEIENIIKSQMPLKEKLKHADFVVDNSYPISNTENQVKKIINNIKN
ncbi:dephospho-CoA kinase [Candidatus Woesearchaeota archaeon]|nr:dephospho-CoA kinase [Candidatus Woesearchaeota archaeon]